MLSPFVKTKLNKQKSIIRYPPLPVNPYDHLDSPLEIQKSGHGGILCNSFDPNSRGLKIGGTLQWLLEARFAVGKEPIIVIRVRRKTKGVTKLSFSHNNLTIKNQRRPGFARTLSGCKP
jgi:hypothetical protein